MKLISLLIGFGLFFLAGCPANAQNSKSYAKEAASVVAKYKKGLVQAARKAVQTSSNEEEVPFSPYLYKLMGPGVYYSSALTDKFRLGYDLPEQQQDASPLSEGMDYRQRLNASIDDVLFTTYVAQPSHFQYYDKQIEAEELVSSVAEVGATTEDLTEIYNKVDEIKDVTDVVSDVDVDIQIKKPNFWATNGKFSLQFTQNYFSENWYKGGNNNVTLLSNLVLEANYNDQKRWTWDNKLDLRLGFVTATSDSCHRYLTNNDKIYLFSKVGLKAAKNWFYTTSFEANSQFLPGYKSNDRRAYSKFMAPLDVYVSLGMDWKPTFKNGNTFSLALLPLSYKMRYINAADETIHSSYNMVGKKFQQDFGSKIELKSKITIVKDLTWQCRFYYFTAYEYTESELENLLSFQFNKYISTEVYTLWRFDDNRSQQYYDSTLGYFQFKEYFTLGLAYNF